MFSRIDFLEQTGACIPMQDPFRRTWKIFQFADMQIEVNVIIKSIKPN